MHRSRYSGSIAFIDQDDDSPTDLCDGADKIVAALGAWVDEGALRLQQTIRLSQDPSLARRSLSLAYYTGRRWGAVCRHWASIVGSVKRSVFALPYWALLGGDVAQYLSTDRLACSYNLLHRVSYRCRQLCFGRNPCIAGAAISRNRNRKRRTVPISSASSGNPYSKLLPSPSLPRLTIRKRISDR